jgi:AMMECR1 domain-containing protein
LLNVKTTDGRSGLLLPDLEGVDSVEKQISIACQKAGINYGLDKIILYRFTVEKYSN